MPYFYNFPKINYFNKEARNIVLKAAIIKQVLNSVDSFFPYIIKEYERPDIIAFTYYNDENLDWLVYFSNQITDPYYDWPLFGDDFEKYVAKKYNMTIYETMSTIDHYEYTGITGESDNDIARQSWQMSVDTHGQKVAFGEDELEEARFKKGTDIGKKGKGFEKIEKSAAKRYGSEEAGKKVAGSILKKVLNKEAEMDI